MRTRTVSASEPDAEPACRLTSADGRRRQADTGKLFSQLREQRQTPQGQEFLFAGNSEDIWQQMTVFVDEEAICCPFFSFEQIEQEDGVLLKVHGKSIGS